MTRTRPESIAEWEELLVRIELMPRALRHAVEDAGEGDAVREILRALVAREREVNGWLLSLTGGEVAADRRFGGDHGSDARELRERFAALRARTFAMVQRRGLEVWEWEGEYPGEGRLTVYQALTRLLGRDVAALAELRAAGAGAC